MDTSTEPPAQRTERSLLIIAILAGMSTAACIVVFQAIHKSVIPNPFSAAKAAPVQPTKPSAFGVSLKGALPPDVKLSTPQIEQAGNRAIVTVAGFDADDKQLTEANGYIYSASGIVVTSFSAIRGASSVVVETEAGDELNVIAVMGYNPKVDLAVLAVLEGNLTALDTGPGDIVLDGDTVVALGPDHAQYQGVVGPRIAIGGVDLIPISSPAPPGSAVLSEHGKVIGVATRRRFRGKEQTYAIPTRFISDILAERRVLSLGQMLEETAGESQPLAER
jgi:hypothetical protein